MDQVRQALLDGRRQHPKLGVDRGRGAITAEPAERLAHTKLLYGVGDGTYGA